MRTHIKIHEDQITIREDQITIQDKEMTFEGENMCFFYWTVKQLITKIWKGLNLQTSNKVLSIKILTQRVYYYLIPPLCVVSTYIYTQIIPHKTVYLDNKYSTMFTK